MEYSVDDLFRKLKDIEALLHEKTNADGSFDFDMYKVMISLELTRRMIAQDKDSGQTE